MSLLADLYRERRELQKLGDITPTRQDLLDLVDAVRKAHGPAVVMDLKQVVVKEDPEWCIFLFVWALRFGARPQITRERWMLQMERVTNSGEENMSNEIVIKVEIPGLAELIAALTANTAAQNIVAKMAANPILTTPKAEAAVTDGEAAPAPAPVAKKATSAKKAAPVAAPVAAPAPAADDDGFDEPPAAPAAPAKVWTKEEVRAEGKAALERMKAALGDKFKQSKFTMAFWDVGGAPRPTDETQKRDINSAKPENYAKMAEFARNAKPEDYQ